MVAARSPRMEAGTSRPRTHTPARGRLSPTGEPSEDCEGGGQDAPRVAASDHDRDSTGTRAVDDPPLARTSKWSSGVSVRPVPDLEGRLRDRRGLPPAILDWAAKTVVSQLAARCDGVTCPCGVARQRIERLEQTETRTRAEVNAAPTPAQRQAAGVELRSTLEQIERARRDTGKAKRVCAKAGRIARKAPRALIVLVTALFPGANVTKGAIRKRVQRARSKPSATH